MCALDDLVLRFRCALEGGDVTCFLSADLLRTNSDSGVDLTAAFVVRLKKENIVNLVSLRARLRAGPA